MSSKDSELDNDNEENVRVAVRVRPLSQKEIDKGCSVSVSVDKEANQINLTRPEVFGLTREQKSFIFDAVFPETSSQAEIYNDVARPIINYLLEGYNGTIFAYGQTGSGKTHTMEGDHSFPELNGIIPNSFAQIFSHISQASEDTMFLVRVSYLEIYNEEVRDLLGKNTLKKLDIREHKDSGVYVQDLSSFVVRSENDMAKIMKTGNKNRSVAETNMNIESSRSHAIFSITVECSKEHEGADKTFRMGKLNLVDLAGSERISKTGSTGQRLKEGAKINMSLSNLGNVISALVDGLPHIPYRSSKLTRLLQDSLGGNSKTVMIANIGPADYNYEETLSTLRYADRAKHIKNYAVINEDPKDALLRKFETEIESLKRQLNEELNDMKQMSNFVEQGSSDEEPDETDETQTMVPIPDSKTLIEIKGELENQDKISSQVEMESQNKKATLKELRENVLNWKEHEAKKARLEEKLKSIQKRNMVGGENLLDKSKNQEEFLQSAMNELQNRRTEQVKLQDSLSSKMQEKAQLEQEVLQLQARLTDESKRLRKNMKILDRERHADTLLQYEEDTEKKILLRQVRKECMENKKLETFIDFYIPKEALKLIESSIVSNNVAGDFKIPNVRYSGNNLDSLSRTSKANAHRLNNTKIRKNLELLYKSLQQNEKTTEVKDSSAYLAVEPVPTQQLQFKKKKRYSKMGKLN